VDTGVDTTDDAEPRAEDEAAAFITHFSVVASRSWMTRWIRSSTLPLWVLAVSSRALRESPNGRSPTLLSPPASIRIGYAPFFFRLRVPSSGTVDIMTEMFVGDIEKGVGDTGLRAGILKYATDQYGVTIWHIHDDVIPALSKEVSPTSKSTRCSSRTRANTSRNREPTDARYSSL
jgi:hypothetical protein